MKLKYKNFCDNGISMRTNYKPTFSGGTSFNIWGRGTNGGWGQEKNGGGQEKNWCQFASSARHFWSKVGLKAIFTPIFYLFLFETGGNWGWGGARLVTWGWGISPLIPPRHCLPLNQIAYLFKPCDFKTDDGQKKCRICLYYSFKKV